MKRQRNDYPELQWTVGRILNKKRARKKGNDTIVGGYRKSKEPLSVRRDKTGVGENWATASVFESPVRREKSVKLASKKDFVAQEGGFLEKNSRGRRP